MVLTIPGVVRFSCSPRKWRAACDGLTWTDIPLRDGGAFLQIFRKNFQRAGIVVQYLLYFSIHCFKWNGCAAHVNGVRLVWFFWWWSLVTILLNCWNCSHRESIRLCEANRSASIGISKNWLQMITIIIYNANCTALYALIKPLSELYDRTNQRSSMRSRMIGFGNS